MSSTCRLIHYTDVTANLDSLQGTPWLYCGTSYEKFSLLRRRLGDDTRVSTSRPLAEAVDRYRTAYIHYIGNLWRTNSSDEWLLSSITEKNIFNDKTFKNICFIRIIVSLLKESRRLDSLLVVVEDPAVIDLFADSFSRAGITCEVLSSSRVSFLSRGREYLYQRIRFLYHFLPRWAATRFLRSDPPPDPDGYTVFRCWVDEYSFRDGKTFFNKHFFKLPELLEKSGEKIIYCFYILYTLPFRVGLNLLEKNFRCYLLYEKSLSLPGILRIVFRTLFPPKIRIDRPVFEGVRIGEYIEQKIFEDHISNRFAWYFVQQEAMRSWEKKGIRVNKIIYTFENQPWEKLLCRELRRIYPEIQIVAHQHSCISPQYLNHFPGEYERDLDITPTRIVPSGEYYGSLLRRFWTDTPFTRPCAARYRYIFESLPPETVPSKRNIIMVCPPLGHDVTLEVLDMVYRAFGSDTRYEVWLKGHPQRKIDLSPLGVKSLPDHFTVKDGPIGFLFEEAMVVIHTNTTAGPEALFLGVPAIQVISEINLTLLDIISPQTPERRFASTPEELRKEVEECRMIYSTQSRWERFRSNCIEARHYHFGNPTDEVLREVFGE